MSHDKLNEWILARKAEGLWVTRCEANCGTWFAQRHKGRSGRRACICNKLRCQLWRRYWLSNGRAPDAWMEMMWLARHDDRPRSGAGAKRYEDPCFDARGAA